MRSCETALRLNRRSRDKELSLHDIEGGRGFPPSLDGNPGRFGDRQPSRYRSPERLALHRSVLRERSFWSHSLSCEARRDSRFSPSIPEDATLDLLIAC